MKYLILLFVIVFTSCKTSEQLDIYKYEVKTKGKAIITYCNVDQDLIQDTIEGNWEYKFIFQEVDVIYPDTTITIKPNPYIIGYSMEDPIKLKCYKNKTLIGEGSADQTFMYINAVEQ